MSNKLTIILLIQFNYYLLNLKLYKLYFMNLFSYLMF